MSALLDSLNASKGAYFKLKENLQCASAKLVTSKNFLEVSANKISDCFQIDNISADGNTILNNKEKMINNINLISKTIIPAIDAKINEINSNIAKEEARIAEEARRAEEEARRQAEEARRAEEEAKKLQESAKSNQINRNSGMFNKTI